MKEELYVYTPDGSRELLDLPAPSGITLKWVNNLFSDISKLTCSHSYTFKLPMSQRNIRLLDMANDIRHKSAMIRKQVDADFYINGICLCPNANLYVSEVGDTTFSCVMTWRVLKAFETLKNSQLNINQLPPVGNFEWKDGDDTLRYGYPTMGWKNTDSILYPAYDAGIPYEAGTPPKPVVPVFRLIQMINAQFGVKFDIGRELAEGMGALPLANFNNKDYYGHCVYDDFVTYGVVPITGVTPYLSDKYVAKNINLINFALPIEEGSVKQEGSYRRFTKEDDDTKYWREYEYWRDINVSKRHYYGGVATIADDPRSEHTAIPIRVQWNTFIGTERIKSVNKESGVQEKLVEDWNMWKSSTDANGNYSGRYYAHEVYYAQRTIEKQWYYSADYQSVGDMLLLKLDAHCEITGTAAIVVQKAAINAGRITAPDYWWMYLMKASKDDDGKVTFDTVSDNGEDWIGLRSIRREETVAEYIYYFDFGVEYIQRRINVEAVEDDELGYFFWSGYEYTPPEDATQSMDDIYQDWDSYDKDRGLVFGYDSSSPTRREIDNTDTFDANDVRFDFLNLATITPSQEVVTKIPVEMKIMENLPSISCFDFMKNIFYMNGAIPKVDKDGETVVAMYYNQLRDRIIAGESLDWSEKLLKRKAQPKMSKYENTNFGQKNFFEMAYSKRTKTEDDLKDELEQYGDGFGTVGIADSLLAEEKVLFTSKFFPGLQRDIAYPEVKPGRTLKVWDGEKNIVTTVNPIYGYLNLRALDDTFEEIENARKRPIINEEGLNFKHIRMNTFEPFDKIEDIFGYLASILENYTCVKEEMMLTEMDLRNFDESVPVYLDKYNQFFAVSSIQRDRTGMSTVELVALPYVVPTYKPVEQMDIDTIFYTFVPDSSFLGLRLNLTRTYTSNPCPFMYDLFVNGHNEGWPTNDNTLSEPLSNNDYYLSRWVSPMNDSWNNEPYTLRINVSESAYYRVTKKRGSDVIYSERRQAVLKVWYDGQLLAPGVTTKTFTKAEDGQYHIIKIAFDAYNLDGELVGKYRKKLYYFVYSVDKSVIDEDWGDEDDEISSVKVDDVTVSGGSQTIIDTTQMTYRFAFSPTYADVTASSVEVTADSNKVTVSDVSLEGFKLAAKARPTTTEVVTLTIRVTLSDGTSFEKPYQVTLQAQELVIDGANEYEAPNGTGSQTYRFYTQPTPRTVTVIDVTSSNPNMVVSDITSNSFKLSASNLAATANTRLTVRVQFAGDELTATKDVSFIVKNSFDVSLLDNAGAMIIDRNGMLYTKDEWVAAGVLNEDADGIAVSDGTHRFIIGKELKYGKFGGCWESGMKWESWGAVIEYQGILVSGQFTTTDQNTAKTDFNGVANTNAIIQALSSTEVGWVKESGRFVSGLIGYLGTAGEYAIINDRKSLINTLLAAIGGQALGTEVTSTQYDTQNEWYRSETQDNPIVANRKINGFMRAFAVFQEKEPVQFATLDVSGDEGAEGVYNTQVTSDFTFVTSPSNASISDVTVESSSNRVTISNVTTSGFRVNVLITKNEDVTITIRAKVNGLTKIVTKTFKVFLTGDAVYDMPKLDEKKVLIIDKELNLYTKDEWTASGKSNSDAEGVAFSDGTHRFIIAKVTVTYMGGSKRYDYQYWGGYGRRVNNLEDGITHDGYANTQKIIASITEDDGFFRDSPYSAAAYVANRPLFPSGKKGYLPSIGEFEAISSSAILNQIDELLRAIGGDRILLPNETWSYWTSSTYFDVNQNNKLAYVWCQKDDQGWTSFAPRSEKKLIRIFRKIER